MIQISLNTSIAPALPAVFILEKRSNTSMEQIVRRYTSEDITIITKKTGALAVEPASLGLYVNLSHGQDLSAYAIGKMQIGVDIEPHNDDVDIPWNVLHDGEQLILKQTAPHERATIFYQIWTGKEACVKALGLGFRIPSNSFCVRPNNNNGQLGQLVLGGQTLSLQYQTINVPQHGLLHVSIAQFINSL